MVYSKLRAKDASGVVANVTVCANMCLSECGELVGIVRVLIEGMDVWSWPVRRSSQWIRVASGESVEKGTDARQLAVERRIWRGISTRVAWRFKSQVDN
jgi:hypothetical protein